MPQLLLKQLAIFLWLLILPSFIYAQQIRLNELCSKNDNIIKDQEGDYSDWIELYNNEPYAVALKGMYLSDNSDDLLKWKFPDGIIPSKGHFLVFASGENNNFDGELHSNFKLSSSGEELFLSDLNGNLIDSIVFPELDTDISFGRIEDNADTWVTFNQPTPLAANGIIAPQFEIEFSQDAGIYSDNVNLELTSNSSTAEIRYTLDGSDPTIESSLYTDPILLTNRENDPNVFSLIQCTETPYLPSTNVSKINTVRAQLFLDSVAVSKLYTKSFIIEPDTAKYNLPIFSIVTDPANLFDDTIGIYVLGHTYPLDSIANFMQRGDNWERAAHLELIDPGGELLWSQGFGLRIHGNGSRRGRQKSFRLLGKSKYGNKKLEYPVFPEKDIDKYEKLVLRKTLCSNDSFISDFLAFRLLQSTNVASHGSRPVLAFINGEFWGLYALTEKIDQDFLDENFDVDEDSVDLLGPSPGNETCGNNDAYYELVAFMENNDMQEPEVYEYVSSQIDIDNFIDYLIIEFYMANLDWPYNNNYFWKTYAADAKWRWGITDLDFCFAYRHRPSFRYYLNQAGEPNTPWATFMGRKLFENENFVNQFAERTEFLFNTLYTKENIMENYVVPLREQVSSAIQAHIDRYDLDLSYEEWDTKIIDTNLVKFVSLRPCNFVAQITDTFDVSIEIPECEWYVFPSDTMMIDTMAIDTMMIDTMAIDTMMIDTMAIDTMMIDTMMIDTMAIDTMVIDTMMIDTMVIDTIIDPLDGIVEFECLNFSYSNNSQLIINQSCFEGFYDLKLTDISGRQIHLESGYGEISSIKFENVVSGIYIIVLESSGKRFAKKLFVSN